MSCAACSARVERAVKGVAGVESCEVNLLLGSMNVSGSADESAIVSAVRAAGYGATPLSSNSEQRSDTSEEGQTTEKKESKSLLARLISSVVLLAILMYVSMGHSMWGAPLPGFFEGNPLAVALLQALLSASIMLINRHFFVNGVRGVLHLAPNMDTLVALGSGASFVYSLCVLFLMTDRDIAGAHELLHGLYFESAAMILALITVGKLLESRAKGKTTDAIKALMNLTPKVATVERDGIELRVPAKELRLGDIIIVRRGENIPADGELIYGECSVDEAALTGESMPQDKVVGATAYGGTAVLSGYAKIKATKVGEDTAISGIVKMVKEASAGKAPVAKVADKVAGIFVPTVILIALIATGAWLIAGESIGFALARGVSVLVISCPCALGLATPVAIMVGSGVGARCGILFKTAASIEAAGRIKTAVFDKTGTVTEGKPHITDVIVLNGTEEELLNYALSLEIKSEHPLAKAITEHCKKTLSEKQIPECEGFSARLGGVFGRIYGTDVYGGNLKFIEESRNAPLGEEIKKTVESLSSEGKTALIFASVKEPLGIIAVADRIKPDTRAAITAIKEMGIKTVMLTGDSESCALSIARQAGIDRVISGVFPDEKAEHIKKLATDGRVCMIGDGINDAPALTVADLGMAVGAGVDIAIDSADVVLVKDEVTSVCNALRLGRKTLKNIYMNLFWAFCYNIVGIPLAAGAFIPVLGWAMEPMFGAAAMSISSFLVVMNSLSLNLFRPTRVEKINEKTEASDLEENKEKNNMESKVTLKIEGMMCPHCSGRVRSSLEALTCVEAADVSHERADAVITLKTACERELLVKTVEDAGYKVIG